MTAITISGGRKRNVSKTGNCVVLDFDQCCLRTMDSTKSLIDLFRKSERNGTKPELLERLYILYLGEHAILDRELFISRKEFEEMHPKYKRAVDIFTMWGIKRPHLDEFLDFCFEHFEKVIVWSAGQRDYVHALVDVLFSNTVRKPDYVWTGDNIYFNDEGDVVKSLEKLVEELDDPLVTMDNIIAIDDTGSTFSENPNNAIHIPVYEPEPLFKEIMRDERSLIKIMDFLKKRGNIFNVKNVDFTKIWK